jgi:hypothetical protein
LKISFHNKIFPKIQPPFKSKKLVTFCQNS